MAKVTNSMYHPCSYVSHRNIADNRVEREVSHMSNATLSSRLSSCKHD